MTDSYLLDERNLILKVSEGDEQAYYSLFVHYASLIRPFVCKIAGSESNADEIIQETFIRVWLNRDKLPQIQNIKAWIFTVASNECMRLMRSTLTYETKLRESGKSNVFEMHGNTPEDITLANEIRKIVNRVVESMPAQRKLIYQLSREHGMKPAEIAQKLSLSVGTVKNVLSFTLKEIRKELVLSGISLVCCYII